MKKYTRTVYGSNMQTSQYLGLPLVIKPFTTLNEKLNIYPELSLNAAEIPRVRYICAGLGGHKTTIGVDGIPLMDPIQHMPDHAALYKHIPFVLRLPSQDLTAVERQRFRLRRMEEHDGQMYVAYYARVLDLTQTIPQMEYRKVQNGITTSLPFETSIANLNPTPPVINTNAMTSTDGDYVASTAKTVFKMDEWDTQEYLNVANILYQDQRYAMMSEFAICSGVDRSLMGDFNGIQIGYTEVVGCQVASFINEFHSLWSSNTGIDLEIDVGNGESMLAYTQQ